MSAAQKVLRGESKRGFVRAEAAARLFQKKNKLVQKSRSSSAPASAAFAMNSPLHPHSLPKKSRTSLAPPAIWPRRATRYRQG